jgi:hypothetical protein
MIPIVLRELRREDNPPPGELWVRAREARQREERADALLMIRSGPEAFAAGDAVERVVVSSAGTGPTFDEMLAASLAVRRLEGQDVRAYEPFARYTQAVRHGLIPTEQAPDEAMENIFQAIRNQDGSNLADPVVAEHFLEGWQRMMERITAAAQAGQNPIAQALFAADPSFVQERAFLRKDQEPYRADVQRGRSWEACLPGGLARCSALLLRQPRSLLFKYWARIDNQTPTGEPYQLLAVDWGGGVWICSTDPVHRLSLQELAEQLQRAESAANPAAAAANAWFDGKPFHHTLIAAPRGGSRLESAAVEQIILDWTKLPESAASPKEKVGPARPPRRLFRVPARRAVLAALSLALIGTAAVAAWWYFDRPRWLAPWPQAFFHRDVQGLQPGQREAVFTFPSDVERDVRFQVGLRGKDLRDTDTFTVQLTINTEPQTASGSIRGGLVDIAPVEGKLRAGDNKVHVRLADDAPPLQQIDCAVCERQFQAVLHVLTVGVSSTSARRGPTGGAGFRI